MTDDAIHPCDALLDAREAVIALPVCDQYSGVEARMRKCLALQAELGPVFDVTFDCEDGAPVGDEAEHAHMAAEFVMSAATHRQNRQFHSHTDRRAKATTMVVPPLAHHSP